MSPPGKRVGADAALEGGESVLGAVIHHGDFSDPSPRVCLQVGPSNPGNALSICQPD